MKGSILSLHILNEEILPHRGENSIKMGQKEKISYDSIASKLNPDKMVFFSISILIFSHWVFLGVSQEGWALGRYTKHAGTVLQTASK